MGEGGGWGRGGAHRAKSPNRRRQDQVAQEAALPQLEATKQAVQAYGKTLRARTEDNLEKNRAASDVRCDARNKDYRKTAERQRRPKEDNEDYRKSTVNTTRKQGCGKTMQTNTDNLSKTGEGTLRSRFAQGNIWAFQDIQGLPSKGSVGHRLFEMGPPKSPTQRNSFNKL